MNNRRIAAAALVTSGVVLGLKVGCREPAPDEQLAEHFGAMCSIARGNIDTPVRGVNKLGQYLDEHAGHMLAAWGATLVSIERIPDDVEHDDRARLARDRLRKPLRKCQDDWRDFVNAVDDDPEASALATRAMIRFNRTLQIILEGRARVDLLHVPLQLDRLFDR
jgi:hypothetical protein